MRRWTTTTWTFWGDAMNLKVNGITAITPADAEVIRRTLEPKRDPATQLAIESWLATGNRPQKIPTGQSGIYDEFGLPRSKGRNGPISQTTIKRVMSGRQMEAAGMKVDDIARSLGMSSGSYRSMMHRWGTGG